jgi:hypothetical protein
VIDVSVVPVDSARIRPCPTAKKWPRSFIPSPNDSEVSVIRQTAATSRTRAPIFTAPTPPAVSTAAPAQGSMAAALSLAFRDAAVSRSPTHPDAVPHIASSAPTPATHRPPRIRPISADCWVTRYAEMYWARRRRSQ